MFLNLNPSAIGIAGLSFRELADLAARHGFGGIDCGTSEWGGSAEAARRAGEYLRDKGLRWGLFGMPFDVSSCSDAEYDSGMQRLRDALPLVAAAGCSRTYNHIWPGSADALEPDKYRDRLLGRLTPLARLLGEYGVEYGLEFLGPKHLRDPYRHPCLFTLGEMVQLADALPQNVGVVLDSFHWYTSGGTVEEVRTLLAAPAGARVVCVHLNDARPGRSREEQRDGERDLPGATGVIDLRGLVDALDEIGYDGPAIAEPFQPQRDRLSALPPDEAASEVAAVMRRAFGNGDR